MRLTGAAVLHRGLAAALINRGAFSRYSMINLSAGNGGAKRKT